LFDAIAEVHALVRDSGTHSGHAHGRLWIDAEQT
jgi:hypothetical protein